MFNWHTLSTEEAISRLNSNTQSGLTKDEAKQRLDKYGSNELEKEKGTSTFALFLSQFKNMLIIILMVAVLLSVFVGEFLDAIIISVIVLFSALLGFIQEYRAERALDSLKKMLSPTTTVIRDGKEEDVYSKDLVPGDLLSVKSGDKIPADARLIVGYSLTCDEAALTGESAPVAKDILPLSAPTGIAEQKNMLFAGTIVSFGRGRAIVTSTGMNTEFGKIAKEVASAETKKTPLERRTEEIGKWLGIISLGICFTVAGISIAREAFSGTLNISFFITTVMFAIALAVAAVPEALAAIVTGALAIGMQQMAKQNALVRKMPAVETLGCTTVICTDKTGTLTKGEMTITKMFTAGRTIDVTGVGYEPKGNFMGEPGFHPGMSKVLRRILLAGIFCNDSTLEKTEERWSIKGDPTEAAFLVAALKAGLAQHDQLIKYPRTGEIPFSSERKRMSTLHNTKDGKRLLFMKGATEEIINRCSLILDEKGTRTLTEADIKQAIKANEEMAKNALRVLGLSYQDVSAKADVDLSEDMEKDMVFLGLAGMIDPPRKEAMEAVKVCKKIGIRTVMITGDHQLTAMAIAKEIGIYNQGDRLLTGADLEKMSQDELEGVVDKTTVYARVSPLHKLNIVKAWKAKGEIVAMTGDGVNDAPALKHADIGIAMGITGTDVTKDASDMVLSDDNFATIVKAIERGRWIYDNIRKYLTYLLRCNITEVVVIGGIVLILGPEHLPLLPAAILYINLATDGLPALALGIAPPDPDIMDRPPRDPNESIFSREMKMFVLIALLVEVPCFYFLFFSNYADITLARTQIFFLFIIIELVVALNFRSLTQSVFALPPHKWLVLSIVWELVLLGVIVQFQTIRESLGITLPTFSSLAVILSFSGLVFFCMEATKKFVRMR
ncbi:MAG: cation-translocating P-type ATPase [Pseudomonadota bacterium]